MPAARIGTGHFVMAAVLLLLGYFLLWPALILLINSFNAATDWFVEPRRWGTDHWINAFQRPGLLKSLGNSPSTKFVIPTEFTRLVEPLTGYINRGMGPGGARGSAE